MTNEDVIRLAKEAGMIQDADMWFSSSKEDMDVSHEHLVAFAKLIQQSIQHPIQQSIQHDTR